MPRTRGSASAAAAATAVTEVVEPEANQEQGQQQQQLTPGQALEETGDALKSLQFNQPLSWRAGRPIPLADLLRRLQDLSKELRDMDQEDNDRESFTKVAKELSNQLLLGHKDKGVRAWTACCLVDMLRLCAPNAPFTRSQLKDIFTLFVTSILPALADPSNAYNNQHMYVLQSLAEVKSIVLLTDLPSAESLNLHLFSSFFDILSGASKSSSGEQLGKHVEFHMTAILVMLVDESNGLPTEVVDIIVAQFLRADPRLFGSGGKVKRPIDERQTTLLHKELPAAYNMAKTLCNACSEKMARCISQYFNDVILEASASSLSVGPGKSHSHRRPSDDASDDEDGPAGPTEDELKQLHKAHRLLRELWRACPAVLQNVIPQLEAELSAENVQLRLLATETLGDMVSGIGAAGPPPPPVLDAAAYPQTAWSSQSDRILAPSILTTPSSPQPFFQTHPAAYNSFINRKQDKSALIRSAWTTGVGRILSTSAGGIGLSEHDEQALIKDLAIKFLDSDERVRLAAVKSVGLFSLRDVITKLGSIGGIEKEGSLLSNLAGRCRDRKHSVRVEGMRTLGRIWGVSFGEIAQGNEAVSALVASIPSKIFDTFYINDLDVNVLLDHVIFEFFLPLGYPPIKSRASKAQSNGKEAQANGDAEKDAANADQLRAERILGLVKDLEPKAKKAFFAIQGRQVQLSQIMSAFLKRCEEFNGGVMDSDAASIKSQLAKLIDWLSKTLPDAPRVSADLWKFAKMHDRRSYQLVRFCMDPKSDYRTVHKAIKELTKRIESSPGSPAGVLETFTPLVYRVSVLVYNKSHVAAFVEYSRTNNNGLGSTAHEVLEEVSTRNPEGFKGHVKELCELIESQAPSAKKTNDESIVDTLKACAGYAQRFPSEMPQDRKFAQSLVNFALFGSPAAAGKHAVTIIMASTERKEMYAKDLVQKCVKGFAYGSPGFLVRLATLAQLMLKARQETDDESDAVVEIAISEILQNFRTPKESDEERWAKDDQVDDECHAKLFALKILVNRIRSHGNADTLKEAAEPVVKLLNNIIANDGEISKDKTTPPAHRSRLRLLAGQLFLKLCTIPTYDSLLTPADFNRLACLAQDSLYAVRAGFVNKLKRYLGQDRLPQRFFTIVFLLAYEPQADFREDTVTWVRSRAKLLQQHNNPTLENNFARLLSLLAHHPDFTTGTEDLTDFAKYILFYLNPIATADNISLIFHVAQRVKQTRDAIDPTQSENLYYLSDLAQAVIRRYADIHAWSLQTWPGKLRLPSSLFAALPSHKAAQDIAMKTFLPTEVLVQLDGIVRAKAARPRKRKSDGHTSSVPGTKRSRSGTTTGAAGAAKGGGASAKSLSIRKRSKTGKSKPRNRTPTSTTPDAADIPWSERRRSERAAGKVTTYAESSDSDAEEEEEEAEDVEMGEGEGGVEDDDEGDDASDAS
ncbi:MAG: hypothetical protein M1825_002055 [Sarcosagium campestre]|nr:MAG: hypothetical protein M1825_002055 [Sarcosagium campestre]